MGSVASALADDVCGCHAAPPPPNHAGADVPWACAAAAANALHLAPPTHCRACPHRRTQAAADTLATLSYVHRFRSGPKDDSITVTATWDTAPGLHSVAASRPGTATKGCASNAHARARAHTLVGVHCTTHALCLPPPQAGRPLPLLPSRSGLSHSTLEARARASGERFGSPIQVISGRSPSPMHGTAGLMTGSRYCRRWMSFPGLGCGGSMAP